MNTSCFFWEAAGLDMFWQAFRPKVWLVLDLSFHAWTSLFFQSWSPIPPGSVLLWECQAGWRFMSCSLISPPSGLHDISFDIATANRTLRLMKGFLMGKQHTNISRLLKVSSLYFLSKRDDNLFLCCWEDGLHLSLDWHGSFTRIQMVCLILQPDSLSCSLSVHLIAMIRSHVLHFSVCRSLKALQHQLGFISQILMFHSLSCNRAVLCIQGFFFPLQKQQCYKHPEMTWWCVIRICSLWKFCTTFKPMHNFVNACFVFTIRPSPDFLPIY